MCWPSGCLVFKKLEDFDLTASFQLAWLRNNDSKLLKDFIATTRQVACESSAGRLPPEQPISGVNSKLRSKLRTREVRLSTN
jgi:hypothetical protein